MTSHPDHIDTESAAQKSFILKASVLIGIVLLCSVLGSALLLGLAACGGMDIGVNMDIFAAVTDTNLKPFIKAGIGFNHLAMFSLSAMLFAYWLRKSKWVTYFHRTHIDFELAFKFVLLLVLAYPLIGLSATALEHIDLPAWADSMDDESIDTLMKILAMDGVGDLVVNLIIVALIPAIGEELLFRGVIQNELIQKIKNPHVAILIASVIFSGFHLQVQGFLPKLIIGLILGYAYFWTKSIWYPMIIHFVNNATQTFILFFIGSDMAQLESQSETPETLQLVIGVIISCFLCYILIRHIQRVLSAKTQTVDE